MKQKRDFKAEAKTRIKNKTKNILSKLVNFVIDKTSNFAIAITESYHSNKIKLAITIGFFSLITIGTYNMEEIVKYSKRKQVEQIKLVQEPIPSELRFTTPFDKVEKETKRVGLNAELSKNFR